MARKLIVRIGTERTVPILEVGEPGYDTDKKVGRIGDGTNTPPRFATDKSANTSFEYPGVEYFKYREIRLYENGKVDGVTPSKLNKTNGLMVRQGDNAFGAKTIEGQKAVDTAGNSYDVVVIDNGDVSDTGTDNKPGTLVRNIKIKLGDVVLQKVLSSGIDKGNTNTRPPNPEVGTFRYNSDTALFEGWVDSPLRTPESRMWRSLPNVFTGATEYIYGTHFATVAEFKEWVKTRITTNEIALKFPAGRNQVSGDTWNFDEALGRNITMKGEDPINIPLAANPIVSVTGSSNNWSVTYQLQGAPPAGITVNSFVAIDCPKLSGLTGSHTGYTFGASEGNSINGRTTFSSFSDPGIGDVDINKAWVLNQAANPAPALYARKVQAVTSTSLTLASAFTHTNAIPTFYVAEEIGSGVAQLTAGSGNVSVSGVTASNFLDPEDIVCFFVGTGQVYLYRVQGVSASSITLWGTATVSLANATILYIKTNILNHCGAWRVSNIDTANNRITLNNKGYNIAPASKLVKNLTATYIPSIVERVNNVDHVSSFSYGILLNIRNMMLTASTDYTYRCFNVRNGRLKFSGMVGLSRWQQPGYFEGADVLGSGDETIFLSDNTNLRSFSSGSDNSNAFTSSFEFYASRAILNGIVLSGNVRAPVYTRAQATMFLSRLIGVSNDGVAYRCRDGSVSMQDSYFAFNGPNDSEVNFSKNSRLNFRACTFHGKYAAAGQLSPIVGAASNFFCEGTMISSVNGGLSNFLSCPQASLGGLAVVYSASMRLAGSNAGASSISSSAIFFQGGSIIDGGQNSQIGFNSNIVIGSWTNIGGAGNISDSIINGNVFIGSTAAGPMTFSNQGLSRGLALSNSPAITVSSGAGGTGYTA